MKLYVTPNGMMLDDGRRTIAPDITIDQIFTASDPVALVADLDGPECSLPDRLLAPIGSQEVWAAGVTYFASREARIEESESAQTVYERVYDADRPELFFKSTASRVVGPGAAVRIRRDSTWDVPEPELALAISSTGKVFGYCVGNDMSSRSIEGDNPLYLPQAKTYDRSTALGPCIQVAREEPDADTEISLRVDRGDTMLFVGSTRLGQMKRRLGELVDYLHRELTFPTGCFLLTGTGIVPGSDVTLLPGDSISISIDHIGTLSNHVERRTQS